ncbi:DUF4229 domain-containing protein [Aquipuribacter sp. SD81]|uniref:DUF4229 domain-containing protein n=1 Tax=Aquipuribacter sp. SD81 TaxID=3127703 RepID=UPI00301613F4
MRPVAVYSALRLGMFLAVFLVLRLVGVGGILSLVVALVISMLLSFVVLRRQRDAVTLALIGSQERRRQARTDGPQARPARTRRTLSQRLDSDAAAEDALLDAREPRPDDPAAGRADRA